LQADHANSVFLLFLSRSFPSQGCRQRKDVMIYKAANLILEPFNSINIRNFVLDKDLSFAYVGFTGKNYTANCIFFQPMIITVSEQ
jgi:hypothetical protein